MKLVKKINKIFKFLKKISIKEWVFSIGAFAFLSMGICVLWFSSLEIPELSSFNDRIFGESTKIFDKTGKVLLYDMGQNMKRTVVPFEEISDYAKKATIAIEDAEFYNHHGIKITSFFRAVLVNIQDRSYSQGGSTITQQVVKNSLLTREKTITRKIKEMFLAIKLERALDKDQILNLYLNDTPYGGTVYGIEEASLGYFGTSSSGLSLAQAAYLAALPKAPSYYSPFGSHRDELEARKNLVLEKMYENKFITREEADKARVEKVSFSENVSGGIKAPHFAMYIREYLSEKYGDRAVLEGGLRVTTTLDYELQKKAEDIVKKYAIENGRLYHATNAALTAIDSKTGQILVMVGSRDFFDKEVDGEYNIVTAKRQPGSSFKPLVYTLAFEKGYTDETILFDLKTQFSTSCEPSDMTDTDNCYSPDNYDGKFRGPMTLRNALAQSINIPAVKLLYMVGIDNAIEFAQKLGITTLTDPRRYGLSLVLGGGEVTLLDMTSAYSVFANQGVKNPPTGILEVKDKTGNVLEKWEDKSERVVEKYSTLLISDILRDDAARAPIFGARGSLYFPTREVAVKTGTTNNYRDAWVVGYTPQIAVGAWAGNNDNTPIDRKVAGYIVAPMWHVFMDELLKTLPDEKFERPEEKDLSELKPVFRGVWQTEDSRIHEILYSVDRNDPLGPSPKNPANDPQFNHWEYPLSLMGGSFEIMPGGAAVQGGIQISFLNPQNKDIVRKSGTVQIIVSISGEKTAKEVSYFLDGTFIGKANSPFLLSFTPSSLGIDKGKHSLKAVVTATDGTQKSETIEIEVD
ncbi:MAG: penicillin-binding protein [Patescibacteria group bacterium]|nr:penicillin-binding protein [Patescibacteria group bacterium]